MRFKWETDRERILRGLKISPKKKLEGLKLMNELTFKILTKRQKAKLQRIRKAG